MKEVFTSGPAASGEDPREFQEGEGGAALTGPSEFFVVKIHPEPNPRTAVVDVEGARFGISGDDKKHEQGFRELDPFRDSGVLGHIE